MMIVFSPDEPEAPVNMPATPPCGTRTFQRGRADPSELSAAVRKYCRAPARLMRLIPWNPDMKQPADERERRTCPTARNYNSGAGSGRKTWVDVATDDRQRESRITPDRLELTGGAGTHRALLDRVGDSSNHLRRAPIGASHAANEHETTTSADHDGGGRGEEEP